MSTNVSTVAWTPGVILKPELLTREAAALIRQALAPAQVMGLTAWREADARLVPGKGWVANPIDAAIDILNVIDNREKDTRWRGRGHAAICLQTAQFSCWSPNGGASNYHALMQAAQQLLADRPVAAKLRVCIETAESFLDGRHGDLLKGSTHYIAEWLKPWPAWAIGETPVVARHGHVFFNTVR